MEIAKKKSKNTPFQGTGTLWGTHSLLIFFPQTSNIIDTTCPFHLAILIILLPVHVEFNLVLCFTYRLQPKQNKH